MLLFSLGKSSQISFLYHKANMCLLVLGGEGTRFLFPHDKGLFFLNTLVCGAQRLLRQRVDKFIKESRIHLGRKGLRP